MKRRFSGGRRRRCSHPYACSAVEPLEERLALAVFNVTTDADAGAGSLRNAINQSNNNAGHDTIEFARPFFDSPRTINLNSILPQMVTGTNSAVTIIGPGSHLLTLRRNAASNFTIIDSYTSALNLSGMTITNGSPTGNGGGIGLFGTNATVNLDDLVVTGNTATNNGGGIFVQSGTKLRIRNCVISNNTAAFGGGVSFLVGGALHVENCTISGNTSNGNNAGAGGLFFGGIAATNAAGFIPGTVLVMGTTIRDNHTTGKGGGIMLGGLVGTLLVQSSTISGNTAADVGGGIAVDDVTNQSLIVRNSTISGNTAGAAGGGISLTAGPGTITIQNSTITANRSNGTTTSFFGGGGIARVSPNPGTITVANSIVSGNTDASASGPDIRASAPTTTHVNHSAVGSAAGFTPSPASGTNLAFGTNLMLGALADNYGPTRTHAPLPGSPLINAGSNARIPTDTSDLDGDGNVTEPVPFDQRGSVGTSGLTDFPRVGGAAVDIGAVERDVVAPAVDAARFDWNLSSQTLVYTFSENVGASLTPADLMLRNLTTSTNVPASNIDWGYDTLTRTAYFIFPGYPNGALPDGNYRATLVGSGVTDLTGNPLATSYVFDFYVLAGDANRDRRVDFDDLAILAQSYNTAGRNFAQGNFDYDGAGAVNFDDLAMLAQRYNTSLPLPAPVPHVAAARAAEPVFNVDTPVSRPRPVKSPVRRF